MRSVAPFLVSVMFLLAACDSDGGDMTYPGVVPATVTISASSTEPLASAGDTQLLTAVVKDAKQSVISTPSVVWSTSAPTVATVAGSSTSATVTAVDDGTAIITAAAGSVQGTVTVTVRRRVVSIELAAPDSVIVAGSTTQLTVVGRDARQNAINGLTGASFTTSNPFSVMVSPTGLVTALFSSFRPFNSTISATVIRDGVTLSATKRIEVSDPAPSSFGFSGLMEPTGVRPEPANSAGEGIVYLTLDGARVQYKLLWSLLGGPPVSAHLHGPDRDDTVADVLVDLPIGDQTTRNGTVSGSFSAADIRPQGGRPAISLDSLVTLFRTPGLAYVDIHSTVFADGEIRGPVFPRQ